MKYFTWSRAHSMLSRPSSPQTTVLKQMRLLYAPERHEQHRSSWRLVIQLNVIAAVRLLLDIHEALAERDSQQRKRHLEDEDGSVTPVGKPHDPVLLARLRLAPLIACEAALRRALGAIDEEEYVQESSATTPASNRMSYSPRPGPTSLSSHALKLKAGWQSRAIPTAVNTRKLNANEIIASESNGSNGAAPRMQVTRRDSLPICVGGDDSDQPTLTSKEQRWRFHDDEAEYSTQHGSTVVYDRARTESMLISMQDDVRALWERNSIRQLKAKGRLPTFMVHFLDQLPRIATARYRPTDQDILQARVRTIGVTEETFRIHTSTYRVIDVGGSRSQRNVWTSFFDQATAIILLAPISAFDQTLAESRHINRLVDSLDILESIVDCRLLSRVSLIIFLNKSDICEKKLLQGVQVSNFFPEYKGPNDFEHVWRWFRQRFRDVVAKHVSCSWTATPDRLLTFIRTHPAAQDGAQPLRLYPHDGGDVDEEHSGYSGERQ